MWCVNKKRWLFVLLMFSCIVRTEAQRIGVIQGVADCGQVVYGHPVSAEFELRNNGNRILEIDKVQSDCDCVVIDSPQKNIGKGKSFEIRARYDARQLGHFEKQVLLYAKGDSVPVVLRMKGVVVQEVQDFQGTYPYALGGIFADKNDVEFDDVHRGDRQVQKIYLFNESQEVLQPVMMHLPDYLSAIVSPSKLQPSHAGVATLVLDSKKLHDLGLTQTSVYVGTSPGDQVAPEKEVTVSVVLLPAVQDLAPQEKALAPVMRLSSDVLDFGSFGGKNQLRGTVKISNIGKRTLEIRSLQMFTAGLKVSLNKTLIPPGSSAKLKVTAFREGLQKARSKPRVLMITNDPDQSKVVIPILVK